MGARSVVDPGFNKGMRENESNGLACAPLLPLDLSITSLALLRPVTTLCLVMQ